MFECGVCDDLRAIWQHIASQSRAVPRTELPPDPDAASAALRELIRDCADDAGGEVAARARAANLGQVYLGLDQTGQERFLHILAEAFLDDDGKPRVRFGGGGWLDVSRYQMRAPACTKLLMRFNGLPEGLRFLVHLRADIVRYAKADPSLHGLETDLTQLLTSWFDVGFLELRRITWDSPASLLEKRFLYEAVHEIQSWDDLKKRLGSTGRCYAFFHPSMPDDPLIFVEIAFTNGVAGNMQNLLASSVKPTEADTAMFYSISNAQRGLIGIKFGDLLLKYVFNELKSEFPNIETFITLSPIPGFVKWLEKNISDHGSSFLKRSGHTQTPSESAGKIKGIGDILKVDWYKDERYSDTIRPTLLRLCARYLVVERRGEEAADAVAQFHFGNGATVERLNWLADISLRGLRQSAGMMVNYNYTAPDLEASHDRYVRTGSVSMSAEIRRLLDDGRRQ